LEWARAETERHNPAAEQLAWFDLRLGELALRFGALGEARRRLDHGLALAPDQWRLLAARARLALTSGDVAAGARPRGPAPTPPSRSRHARPDRRCLASPGGQHPGGPVLPGARGRDPGAAGRFSPRLVSRPARPRPAHS